MRATLPAALIITLALAGAAAAGTPGSADIAALQVGLAGRALYGDDVDGFAGPRTLAGLKKLPGAGGPLDAATRSALGTFGAAQFGDRPLVAGCSGWDVAELQFLLAWHGFPSGRFDGVFGDRTTAALIRFQRWAGIDAIGVAGPATRAALDAPPSGLSDPPHAADRRAARRHVRAPRRKVPPGRRLPRPDGHHRRRRR